MDAYRSAPRYPPAGWLPHTQVDRKRAAQRQAPRCEVGFQLVRLLQEECIFNLAFLTLALSPRARLFCAESGTRARAPAPSRTDFENPRVLYTRSTTHGVYAEQLRGGWESVHRLGVQTAVSLQSADGVAYWVSMSNQQRWEPLRIEHSVAADLAHAGELGCTREIHAAKANLRVNQSQNAGDDANTSEAASRAQTH